MESKRIGAQTLQLATPPAVISFASVGGRMESQGPLGEFFDELSEDHTWGQKGREHNAAACAVPRAGKGRAA